MPEHSGLTNEMIRNTSCWEVVPMYLQPGETKEDLLKKHGGNVVLLIKFLRARAFKEMEIENISEQIEKAVEEGMKKKADKSKASKGSKKAATKSPGKNSKPAQESLF